MNQQLNLSQQQILTLKTECTKAEKLELDLLKANNDVQKLQRSQDTVQRKLQETEKEKGDIESENSKVNIFYLSKYLVNTHIFKYKY